MPISRLYPSSADANATKTELERAGFSVGSVHLLDASTGDTSPAALVRKGASKHNATIYAEAIQAGATLLMVEVPLGFAGRINPILNARRAGDGEAPPVLNYETYDWDSAAPLSSLLRWPVLLKDPTPLSHWLTWKVLSKSQKGKDTSLGFSTLSNKPTPLSSALGSQVLSSEPAPLSKRFNIPVLSKQKENWTTSHGYALLFDNPTPLSSRLGWKVLSNDPAPLSRVLNMPVLTKSQRGSARVR